MAFLRPWHATHEGLAGATSTPIASSKRAFVNVEVQSGIIVQRKLEKTEQKAQKTIENKLE